jgi:hypothetical protein
MPALGYPHAGQTVVRGLSLSEMVPIVILPPLVGCPLHRTRINEVQRIVSEFGTPPREGWRAEPERCLLGGRHVAVAGCCGRTRDGVVVAPFQSKQPEKTEKPCEAPKSGVITVVFSLCLGQSGGRRGCEAVVCGGMREACSTERQRAGHTENCDCFSHGVLLHRRGRFSNQTEYEQGPTGCSPFIARKEAGPDTVPPPLAVCTPQKCHQTDIFALGPSSTTAEERRNSEISSSGRRPDRRCENALCGKSLHTPRSGQSSQNAAPRSRGPRS